MSEDIEVVGAAKVKIINRTQAEITLCADIIKSTKSGTTVEPTLVTFTRKSRVSGEEETLKAREITLPGMKKGSFSPNPVTMAAADWARLSESKVVKALLADEMLEVS